jgi:subtilisin-like proprotein convertase family protein
MRNIYPFLIVMLASYTTSVGQTVNGNGGNIPDNGSQPSTFNITVNGINPSMLGTDFALKSVCVTINHNNVSDLQISLMSPSGIIVPLAVGVGGTGNNFSGTCFSMTATNPIANGTAPFNNTYVPQGNLNDFNNNVELVNGVWKLRIQDISAGTSGTLSGWSMTFGSMPFSSSNLPIVVLNTNGGTIVDDPKIPVGMKIIYNGVGQRNYLTDTNYDYDGLIGIEYRGSTSQGMPKKGYGFETWDTQHDDKKVSLLGMPAESDWTLIANYSDKTLLRNALSYNLANKMGQYAPRTRFCELVIDGSYRGVYLMTEKIKRDSARVGISKLKANDLSGADLTGGYIIKVDKTTGSGGAGWHSSIPPLNASGNQTIYFQYTYPKPDSIQPQQSLYIRSFVDSFEASLNSLDFQNETTGWRRYMDERSVIDFFLINEMSRNVDGYRISTFLHKEKITKGGKLKMGPVWDYDIAWQNADYCSGQSTTGWAYNFNSVCGSDGNLVPFWWSRFRQDSLFNKRLYCRYNELRSGFLHLDSLNGLVDGMATELNEGQARNFVKWPILGTYVWPNPSPIPSNYAGEITKLKQWFSSRLTWMDSQINMHQTSAPPVSLGPDTAICLGNSVPLHAGNYPQVLWNTGQTDTTIFAADASTYFVTVGNKYGCHNSDTAVVMVNPLPDDVFTSQSTSNFVFQFTPAVSTNMSYAWDFGDGNTSDDVVATHTFQTAGSYTVSLTVTNMNGCSATSMHTVQTQTVSIAEQEGMNVSVFPNPFVDKVTVNGQWEQGTNMSITSLDGKKIVERVQIQPSFTIDLSAISSGVYFVLISTLDGKAATFKIIKR